MMRLNFTCVQIGCLKARLKIRMSFYSCTRKNDDGGGVCVCEERGYLCPMIK